MNIPGLELDWTPEGDVAIVRVIGRVAVEDLPSAEEDGARTIHPQTSRVVVDLSRAERISSVALGLIFYYRNVLSQKGGALALAAPSDALRRMLRNTKLDRAVIIFDTLDEAIEAVREG